MHYEYTLKLFKEDTDISSIEFRIEGLLLKKEPILQALFKLSDSISLYFESHKLDEIKSKVENTDNVLKTFIDLIKEDINTLHLICEYTKATVYKSEYINKDIMTTLLDYIDIFEGYKLTQRDVDLLLGQGVILSFEGAFRYTRLINLLKETYCSVKKEDNKMKEFEVNSNFNGEKTYKEAKIKKSLNYREYDKLIVESHNQDINKHLLRLIKKMGSTLLNYLGKGNIEIIFNKYDKQTKEIKKEFHIKVRSLLSISHFLVMSDIRTSTICNNYEKLWKKGSKELNYIYYLMKEELISPSNGENLYINKEKDFLFLSVNPDKFVKTAYFKFSIELLINILGVLGEQYRDYIIDLLPELDEEDKIIIDLMKGKI